MTDPTFFLLSDDVQSTFLVPKFHLAAHTEKCRTRFSFNLTKGVGRTDGEAPERGWAEVNPLAASTREMGPGSRRDTLDSHFNDYNWRKIIGLGTFIKEYFPAGFEHRLGNSLLRKTWLAAIDMAEHTNLHRQLESSLEPQTITKWTQEIEAWEHDPSGHNPFEFTHKG